MFILKKSNLAFLLKTGTYLDCGFVLFIPPPVLYMHTVTMISVHVYNGISIVLPL